MHATCSELPRGPALLARAGVELADAQWLYRQQRAGPGDRTRLDGIRRKVHSFLAGSTIAPHAGRSAA